MTMTKEQIIMHALDGNLFITRNNELARVSHFNHDLSDNPITITILTGSDKGKCYDVTAEGKFNKQGSETGIDLAKPLNPEDIKQLLCKPKNIDMEDYIYKDNPVKLRTRGGHKAYVLMSHCGPGPFKHHGAVLRPQYKDILSMSWTSEGHHNADGRENTFDIVGLWEEDDE